MKTAIMIDDHPDHCRERVMALENSGIAVLAECLPVVEALDQVQRRCPDLLVVNLINNLEGLTLLTAFRALSGAMKILVIAAPHSGHFAQRCLEAGADGYVIASDQLSEFKEAVRMVMRGYSFAPAQDFPTVTHRRYGASEEQRLRMLSAREMTVLILLAKGMGNKQIGAQLSLSEKTVSTYKHRLKIKLNITSLVKLIDFARRYHLL
ncbi:response regulator transcription factor [Pantoea sp. CTOTU50773]|uniref:response regulator transcription factor n=1 Tax=Pantoea sp. CTOTU50773 TaxID=2953853 RepID=UPI0028AE72D0|nr:response regulator transcription factor [Pantoea sp. CTOTU50773]